ncbi:hypothetical protein WR25_11938 [Diploscapter pachys]|uniref:Glutaredoxin domain-containing protein n=1 Tax=Diploscapter pachys TaxID=2018661 RepID=A0A2A2LT49_9BILA|nr:hypothetical protein WR25_11938 [Diploscapter pachys]
MPPGSPLPAAPQYPSHYYNNNYPSIDPSTADRSSAVCNPRLVMLDLCPTGSGYNSYPRGYTNGYSTYGNSNSISPLGYSYAGYIKRQARRYPIMMYTLIQCIPCQRAKHLLAVSYSDVAAHFLELVGDEEWQRQLQADLQQMTGQITFPYIFICGQHIGGTNLK